MKKLSSQISMEITGNGENAVFNASFVPFSKLMSCSYNALPSFYNPICQKTFVSAPSGAQLTVVCCDLMFSCVEASAMRILVE